MSVPPLAGQEMRESLTDGRSGRVEALDRSHVLASLIPPGRPGPLPAASPAVTAAAAVLEPTLEPTLEPM